MSIPILVTGDDVTLPVTLKKNGAVFAINVAAVVKARLVTLDHATSLCDEVVQSHSATGANWAASLVVVALPGAITGAVSGYGNALLEIQVDYSGKATWFIPVTIVQGHID